jgi:hypothetical protein
MAIYKDTYEDAVEFIKEQKTRPGIFAHVEITFGEKYMLDYAASSIPPNIRLIEDLRPRLDDILG